MNEKEVGGSMKRWWRNRLTFLDAGNARLCPDFLWTVLRSGCRTTNSRRSRNESAKLSGAMGLPMRLHLRHG